MVFVQTIDIDSEYRRINVVTPRGDTRLTINAQTFIPNRTYQTNIHNELENNNTDKNKLNNDKHQRIR